MTTYTTKEGSYKGYPVLKIIKGDDSDDSDGEFVVSFGVKKAEAIVKCMDKIIDFVESNRQRKTKKTNTKKLDSGSKSKKKSKKPVVEDSDSDSDSLIIHENLHLS